MPTSPIARLDRLADRFRPAACLWIGGRCYRTEVVGDGTLDPPKPDLPPVCALCGRARDYRIVKLLGVDVSRI